MKIIVSKAAKKDLNNIREYIATDNKKAAAKVIKSIPIHIQKTLKHSPYIGRIYKGEIRELIIPNLPYTVIYNVQENSVDILRVLHQSRDFSKILTQ